MRVTPFRRALGAVCAAATGAQTLVALGCGGAAAKAEPVNPEPPVAAVVESAKGPLLWRVEGETGPSYLFGTVHMGVSLADVGTEVREKLEGADTFISETDLSGINRAEYLALATLPGGEKLSDKVDPQTFAELIRLLSPAVPKAQLERLHPWNAYTSVLASLYGGGPSLDQQLSYAAKSADKKMVYLETWQFQVEKLRQLLDGDDLKKILDENSTERASLAAIIEAYREGDFDRITELIASPEAIAEDPESFKVLFEDRNRTWVPLLLPHLKRGGAFVAVGAGHFAGDVGLLALFEEAGLQVVRSGQ